MNSQASTGSSISFASSVGMVVAGSILVVISIVAFVVIRRRHRAHKDAITEAGNTTLSSKEFMVMLQRTKLGLSFGFGLVTQYEKHVVSNVDRFGLSLGKMEVGDQLLEVNGVLCDGYSHDKLNNLISTFLSLKLRFARHDTLTVGKGRLTRTKSREALNFIHRDGTIRRYGRQSLEPEPAREADDDEDIPTDASAKECASKLPAYELTDWQRDSSASATRYDYADGLHASITRKHTKV